MSRARPVPLPPRLAAVAALVPEGARLADVGSDHGLLPLALLARGHVRFAVATERTEERARAIRRPPPGAAWAGRFAVRAGEGLSPLRSEDAIDTLVVAGLGGRTIAAILGSEAPPGVGPRRLVLQPRTEPAVVRAWLSTHGFLLEAETLVAERGRYHLTLGAAPGDDAELYRDPVLSRDDLLAAGPRIVRARSAEAADLWRRERDRFAAILRRARRGSASRARAQEGLDRAERVLARLRDA